MADGVAITAGAGTTVATDDAGAAGHIQIIKLAVSADGSAVLIPGDAANGLDVDVTRLPGTVAADIASIAAEDFATQTTLAAVLAKISADPATQTTLAAILTDLQAKADLSETQPVSVASLPLPSGAATSALQGAVTETAPASDTASSGLNGRLQRVAQRLTSLIALLPASLGQKAKAASLAVTLASDQDALPITDNGGSLTVDGTVSVNALPAGTANIGDVDVLTLPALPAGTNNIGDVDVLTEPATAADNAAGLPSVVKVVGGYDGANVQALKTNAAGELVTTATVTEGATAADGAASLPAVVKVVAGWDGANVQALATDASGNVQVDVVNVPDVSVVASAGPASATVTQVASSATVVTLQAANADRRGLLIFNDSTAALYVKYGSAASATSFSVKIAAGGYWEMPQPPYSGIVTGIWASANGNAYVTET